MPKTVPTPVSAALGLLPTALDGVRRLPTKAVQLPILALSSALTGMDLARREYDELSLRGERLVARLRGTSFDELEDKVEDVLARTPLAGAYDRVEDALEDAADAVRAGASAGQSGIPHAAKRHDSAATSDVLAAVEDVVAGVTVPADLGADDLPLADYDHLTLGALRGRLRSLDVTQLVALRTYEKSKADRLPVVTMLDNRIAKLAAGEGQPSAGSVAEPTPSPAKAPKKLSAPGAAATTAPQAPPHTKVRHT